MHPKSKKTLSMTKSINFTQIVSIAAPNYGHPPETRTCQDQYVGPLSTVMNQHDFPFRKVVDERPHTPCIILVMESPHKDEFTDEVGPAKGKTGHYIRQYLADVLDCTSHHNSGLILLNAIQNQCSLGIATDQYRDQVFRVAWTNGGENDFKQRLKATYTNGDVLLNCCTKGNDFRDHTPLRDLVERAIRTALPNVVSVRRLHPTNWWKVDRRKQEWSLTTIFG